MDTAGRTPRCPASKARVDEDADRHSHDPYG